MYIYDNNTLEIVTKLDLSKEEFLKDTEKYFKNYNDETMIISEDYIAYPKLTEDGTLREKTTEEKIIEDKKIELLQDGEYIEDNKIIQVPNPSTKYLIYSWNREKFTWELITTKEELQQAKTNLILEHNKKRKEISALNEEADFFDVSESITKANDELEEIRAKINEIDKVIEEMNKNESSISNRA